MQGSAALIDLVKPQLGLLPGVVSALGRVAHSDDERAGIARDELRLISCDAAGYIALLDSRNGGTPLRLPDGTEVARLPGYRLWIWDGEYAGNISLRWQEGTAALPPTCLGHIGYDVVPWRRRRGYAKTALRMILPRARALGLPFVEITADPDNHASRSVIEANGGVFIEMFLKPAALGGTSCARYRVAFDDGRQG